MSPYFGKPWYRADVVFLPWVVLQQVLLDSFCCAFELLGLAMLFLPFCGLMFKSLTELAS